jgi:hypothetical protein
MIAFLIATALWSRHDKSRKPWGDAPGTIALLLYGWIAVSLVFISLAYIAVNLPPE